MLKRTGSALTLVCAILLLASTSVWSNTDDGRVPNSATAEASPVGADAGTMGDDDTPLSDTQTTTTRPVKHPSKVQRWNELNQMEATVRSFVVKVWDLNFWRGLR